MRTFTLDETDKTDPSIKKTPRPVSDTANFGPALVPGMKLYEVIPNRPTNIQFGIPHICVTMDGTRDALAPQFYVPEEDLTVVP